VDLADSAVDLAVVLAPRVLVHEFPCPVGELGDLVRVLFGVPPGGFRCACDNGELAHHGHDRSLSAEGFGPNFDYHSAIVPNGTFRQRQVERTLTNDEFFRQRLSS
jgi:hypothetical protein